MMDLDQYDWDIIAQGPYGAIGYHEIQAVLNGVDAAESALERPIRQIKKDLDSDHVSILFLMKLFREAVRTYHESSEQDDTEQLSLIIEILRQLFADDTKKANDSKIKRLGTLAMLTDAPAYVVKVIAETFDRDLWELRLYGP